LVFRTCSTGLSADGDWLCAVSPFQIAPATISRATQAILSLILRLVIGFTGAGGKSLPRDHWFALWGLSSTMTTPSRILSTLYSFQLSAVFFQVSRCIAPDSTLCKVPSAKR